nr:protein SPIRAL1-like 1 [Ipomoea batatas]
MLQATGNMNWLKASKSSYVFINFYSFSRVLSSGFGNAMLQATGNMNRLLNKLRLINPTQLKAIGRQSSRCSGRRPCADEVCTLSPIGDAALQKFALKPGIMGRGVSFGGGQSSLGYLFGSGEPPKPTTNNAEAPLNQGAAIPAGVPGSKTNNYFRADGQNCGNFLTDRPTTKVHAAPGGGSSLDYLFGGGSSKSGVCTPSQAYHGSVRESVFYEERLREPEFLALIFCQIGFIAPAPRGRQHLPLAPHRTARANATQKQIYQLVVPVGAKQINSLPGSSYNQVPCCTRVEDPPLDYLGLRSWWQQAKSVRNSISKICQISKSSSWRTLPFVLLDNPKYLEIVKTDTCVLAVKFLV